MLRKRSKPPARSLAFGLLAAALGSRGGFETSGVEAATSPWWKEPDGVLARFAAMPPLWAKLLFD
jgi:hypothetical protein